jgi:hypothetical protein
MKRDAEIKINRSLNFEWVFLVSVLCTIAGFSSFKWIFIIRSSGKVSTEITFSLITYELVVNNDSSIQLELCLSVQTYYEREVRDRNRTELNANKIIVNIR